MTWRKAMKSECIYLELLDSNNIGCPFTDCKHNVFWKELKIKKPKETEKSIEFRNCMVRFNENYPLVMDDIAEMWGISRQRIDQMEKYALKRVTKKICFNPEQQEEMRLMLRSFPDEVFQVKPNIEG
jgi:hypothetical protein